ncbi:MAG: RNB domain-containing ribonuclease [Actinomycetota bacterium]
MARSGRMTLPDDTAAEFRVGFARLREDFDVPSGHPDEVLAAAEDAAARPFDVIDPPSTSAGVMPGQGPGPSRWQHVDRTDVGFVTLDPATSTDLDQAFAIERSGADLVLRYAIADVGWFVRPGDPIDREAWRRGVTVYLPDGRAGLHPERIAEDAGSLLPGSPKPAVVFSVRVAGDGAVALDGAERAMVRSRAKLAYDSVTPADLPADFDELARRIEANETSRGAERIQWPEQEVVRNERGCDLRFRPRNVSEQRNAAMSLATNMAVAEAMFAAGTGLFRTMPPVADRLLGRLRHTARAFGLDWPAGLSLGEFERSLDPADARTAAFQIAVRRASGGAAYTPFAEFVSEDGPADGGVKDGRPWHAAVAATYCHATAPLRRLADRYVVEATLAVANGRAVPDEIDAAFAELPDAMRRGDALANRVDRGAIDLAEAILLDGRVGEVFDAVVTDEDQRGVRIQICEPAVVSRTIARRVDPGDDIRVRLESVDVDERRIDFDRVG